MTVRTAPWPLVTKAGLSACRGDFPPPDLDGPPDVSSELRKSCWVMSRQASFAQLLEQQKPRLWGITIIPQWWQYRVQMNGAYLSAMTDKGWLVFWETFGDDNQHRTSGDKIITPVFKCHLLHHSTEKKPSIKLKLSLGKCQFVHEVTKKKKDFLVPFIQRRMSCLQTVHPTKAPTSSIQLLCKHHRREVGPTVS